MAVDDVGQLAHTRKSQEGICHVFQRQVQQEDWKRDVQSTFITVSGLHSLETVSLALICKQENSQLGSIQS